MNTAGRDRETCKGVNDFLRPDHLMSEESQMFCETIRKFVDREMISHEDEFDDCWDWPERKENTIIHEIYRKLLIDLGLQKSFVPEAYGGTGGDSSVDSTARVVEVSRGDFGFACSGFISAWSMASLLMPKPNEALLKKFTPLLLRDKINMICSAITEPHAGGSVEDVR